MRTSSRKTTASVLRAVIGIKVPEWAEMLDRSPHSIHDLECGRLELSGALAAKMSQQTGVGIGWLMNGKPKARPLSQFGEKYTKTIFEKVQARKKYRARVEGNNVKIDALEFLRNICNLLVNANRKGNYHLTAYKIEEALNELSTQFGEAKDFNTYEKVLAYVLPVFNRTAPGLPYVPPPEHARNVWEGLRNLAQTMRDNPTAFKPESKRPLKKKQHH